MQLPKNSVTNSADPLSVIALLSCFVAAIFQICSLRKMGMKTAGTGTSTLVPRVPRVLCCSSRTLDGGSWRKTTDYELDYLVGFFKRLMHSKFLLLILM